MFYMKAYPIELRKRVLDAVDKGIRTRNEIASVFQVSTFWIRKLLRQRRDEGNIAPKPQNQGRKPAFRNKQLQELDDFVKKHSDATLEEIKEHFAGRVNCSIVAVHNALKRLCWRYKKNRYEQASKTEKT
jgi:transposase